jgi:hypothetical protein
MSKPSLTIKPANVWLAPAAAPIKMSAVVEVESDDPLGFYWGLNGEWKFYIVDTVYNHQYI